MKRFAVIGKGIQYSLSPRLFAAAYGNCSEMPDFEYGILDVENFDDALQEFLQDPDFVAVNITKPYKKNAYDAATWHSPEAILTGACNTLVKGEDGILRGYNSDVAGVRDSLKLPEGNYAHQTAMVVGASGAGRAAAAAFTLLGFGKIYIANRSHDKLLEATRCNPSLTPISLQQAACLVGECSALVYTLPCEVSKDFTAALCEVGKSREGDSLEKPLLLEANYNNPAFCQSENFHYISGLNWLLHQGLAAYPLMSGYSPDECAMRKVMSMD